MQDFGSKRAVARCCSIARRRRHPSDRAGRSRLAESRRDLDLAFSPRSPAGGLPAFLFGTKHAPDTQAREKPLRIFGAPGLRKLIEAFDLRTMKTFQTAIPARYPRGRAARKSRDPPGIEAAALSTPHTDDRQSRSTYAIVQEHIRLHLRHWLHISVLATFARRVDLLLMECSFVKDKPVEIHLELAEAVQIVRRAEPKKTILTHLYPVRDNVSF